MDLIVYSHIVNIWCEFKSRRGKNKKLTALKSISNLETSNNVPNTMLFCRMLCHNKSEWQTLSKNTDNMFRKEEKILQEYN